MKMSGGSGEPSFFVSPRGGRMRKDRVRRSVEEWQAVMDRFRRSGLEAKAFCRSEGMSVTTFHKWKQRLATGTSAAGFVELGKGEERESGWAMELELPHGVVLRLRG